MKKIHLLWMLAILIIGILAGCGASDGKEESGETANDESEQTGENTDFPITVTDANGDEVTIEEEPKNIVSVMPNATEIAFALGIGDHIVGVTENDDYPEEVEDIDKVGDMELNVEKIISLDPQLVLAHQTNEDKALEQIEEADIPVLVVRDDNSFDEVYDTISLIGEVAGVSEKATEVVDDMKEDLDDLEEKADTIEADDEKSVYTEIAPSPEIYTAGEGTFMDEMLSVIHAENAAADQDGWAEVNEEAAIASNPDVIITTYGSFVDDPVEEVTERDGWDDITAVEKEAVFDVDEDLVSRPGPRLVEGAEELGEAIYPDVFDD